MLNAVSCVVSVEKMFTGWYKGVPFTQLTWQDAFKPRPMFLHERQNKMYCLLSQLQMLLSCLANVFKLYMFYLSAAPPAVP